MRGSWGKAIRIAAYAAGAVLLAALGLALALPVLVDQPRVKAELQRRLSALVHGSLSWDDLDLRLLPAPRGVIAGLRVVVPQRLEARAATLEAGLRFWPLLRGHVNVSSLTARDVEVRLDWTPPANAQPAEAAQRAPDPVAAVRAAAGAAARALHAFAPDTQLAIERGRFHLRLADLPPLQMHDLEVRARTGGTRAQFELGASGEYWKLVKFDADFDYAARAGVAHLMADELAPQAWLERIAPAGWRLRVAPLAVRATLNADGGEALTGELEARTRSIVAARGASEYELPDVVIRAGVNAGAERARVQLDELRIGEQKLLAGASQYAYASREASGSFELDADAGRLLDLARRALARSGAGGLQEFESASGRLRAHAHFSRQAQGWLAGLQLRDTDAAIRLRRVPWPLQVSDASAEWRPGQLDASGIRARLGRSSVSGLSGRLRLDKTWRLESASGQASVDLDELYPWLRAQPALENALRGVTMVNGALDAVLQKASGSLAAPDFALRVVPHRVRVQAEALPGPLQADGGTARLTRSSADFDGVAVATLDARALLSGSAVGIGTQDFRVRARLADGNAGAEAVGWALAHAKAPPQLSLRAPFAFAAERLDWGPGRRLEARASVRFDEQTSLAADVAWQPGLLDLRRLEVRDGRGTSALAVRAEGKQVAGRFSGSMQGAVLGYFLKDAGRYSGRIDGDLRFAAETDRLAQAKVEGRLSGESLDLSWLAGRPLRIEKFGLEAAQELVRIRDAVIKAGKDSATVHGELRRTAQGPVVEATVDTEGVVLDDWLPGGGTSAAAPGTEAAAKPPAGPSVEAAAERELQRWWPLPLAGRIALHSGYVQYGHLRAAPVALVLGLEAERARLEVQQAQVCGIALPFVVEARREGWSASARLSAPSQPVDEVARCLTGGEVQITGNADLTLELKTQGRGRDLLRNLEGTGRFEARDGRMLKFELVGNILALLSIEDLATTAKDVAEGAKGFRYRRIKAAGRLQGGQFALQEGVFESPSASMAANGTVRLADGDTRMTVLVAPFGRVDRVVRGIPIVGYVIGGTLTSIPVGVSGDIRHPVVVPLGPAAVTKELLGVFQRTVTLPGKLAEPPVSK